MFAYNDFLCLLLIVQIFIFLDWHMRIGDDEQAAKRKRMQLQDAVGRVTLRILNARLNARQQKQSQSVSENSERKAGSLIDIYLKRQITIYIWFGEKKRIFFGAIRRS